MKAITLLKQNKTVTERAEQYAQSIKRNLQRDIIDTLVSKKESIEDKIFDLGNFNLETNLNAAQKQMTKEDCEARFKQLIDLDYQLELISRELEIKQKSFNLLFGSNE